MDTEDKAHVDIQFGTGGLRAIMGDEPGQMNKKTVQVITQGLANYIQSFSEPEEKSVMICYDCRIHSKEFAQEAARVLAANKISVHITKELMPTPFCSFGVRHFSAIAGINITASHNPKEYNGYKVYWQDGAQVVSPHDTGILEAIQELSLDTRIKRADLQDSLIHFVGEKDINAYFQAISFLAVHANFNEQYGHELSIVYSPLNGAGINLIPQSLEIWGFSDVKIVHEQQDPDGNFPTTPYPNPETDAALKLGWRDLSMYQADILLVSDPDSDRLSCSFLHNNQPKRLSGNELGSILLHYLITQQNPSGKWATVTTIVSTPLIRDITEKHQGTCFEVLTGFKYIGELIHKWEDESDGYSFLFGMEESLGYLYGTHSRDKDATIAACLTAEVALYAKKQGKNLWDYLLSIYQDFGVYREQQLVLEAKEKEHMTKALSKIRENLPKKLCDLKVVSTEDYLTQKGKDWETEKEWDLELPKSDVLVFHLEDKSRFIFRPSGTEPKLKIYGHVRSSTEDDVEKTINDLDIKLGKMLKTIQKKLFANFS